jgi:hypothetical protein
MRRILNLSMGEMEVNVEIDLHSIKPTLPTYNLPHVGKPFHIKKLRVLIKTTTFITFKVNPPYS